jgi:hypothetical protein
MTTDQARHGGLSRIDGEGEAESQCFSRTRSEADAY